MNKAEFIDQLSKKLNITKKDSKKVLDSILEIITEALTKNDQVLLMGFGKFETSPRKKRTAINPQTREKINVPRKVVPKFKAGKNLREAIQENLEAVEFSSGKIEVQRSY